MYIIGLGAKKRGGNQMALPINKTRLSLVIDKSIQTQLKIAATSSGVTVNGLLNIIINDYLNKSKTADTMQLLSLLSNSQTNQVLLITSLDKLITIPTRTNYNQFKDILQNAFVNKEIPEQVYDGLLSMANCVPIK